ncbi:MAG: ribosome silencing factor [Muribaculaceae bacterium]|nr:ribosome silencing factor [Muribaculaceae bacterium]
MQKPSDLQTAIIDAIQDKKGQKITLIDLGSIESSPAPELIICQARSSAQVSAIADNITEEVNRKLRLKPYNVDGRRNAQWIVIDYGSVMIHVFQPETREFYRLEELWSDGTTSELPDLD